MQNTKKANARGTVSEFVLTYKYVGFTRGITIGVINNLSTIPQYDLITMRF